jgi:RNA polymerase sigma factor (sigma-70 family)
MTNINYSTKSDLEVLEIHQNNSHWKTKQDIETYLYRKYYPLCVVYSRKYSSVSPFDDNMQECYFAMLKAIEYVDANKIFNTNSFSFGVVFKMYLSSHFNNQIQYESYESKCKKDQVSLHQEIDNEEEIVIEGIVPSHEEETIFSLLLKEFKSTLKDIEIRIWEALEEGKTQREIAKQFNKSSINFRVNSIKSKYTEFMNKNGYAIEM